MNIGKDTNVPSNDCISRQAALDAVDTWPKYGCNPDGRLVPLDDDKHYVPYVHYDDIVHALEHLPSAQPERKMGKWVEVTDGICIWKVCDQCGEKPLWNEWRTDRCESNFCPNCGADMREGEK